MCSCSCSSVLLDSPPTPPLPILPTLGQRTMRLREGGWQLLDIFAVTLLPYCTLDTRNLLVPYCTLDMIRVLPEVHTPTPIASDNALCTCAMPDGKQPTNEAWIGHSRGGSQTPGTNALQDRPSAEEVSAFCQARCSEFSACKAYNYEAEETTISFARCYIYWDTNDPLPKHWPKIVEGSGILACHGDGLVIARLV